MNPRTIDRTSVRDMLTTATLDGSAPNKPSRPNPPTEVTRSGYRGGPVPQRSNYDARVRIIRAAEFVGDEAWDADHIATIDGATVKLHWTDQPYIWHINDGKEVFAVLDGMFDMHVRSDGLDSIHRLEVGDVFVADVGVEHVAHPVGPSRALVVESEGSL